jgi:hypothetical protein
MYLALGTPTPAFPESNACLFLVLSLSHTTTIVSSQPESPR